MWAVCLQRGKTYLWLLKACWPCCFIFDTGLKLGNILWEAGWDSRLLKDLLLSWRVFPLSDEERDCLKFSSSSRFRAKPSQELQRELCDFLNGSRWSKHQPKGLSLVRGGLLLICAQSWKQQSSLSGGALAASWNGPAACSAWGAALAPLLVGLQGRGVPFSAHSWPSLHPCLLLPWRIALKGGNNSL